MFMYSFDVDVSKSSPLLWLEVKIINEVHQMCEERFIISPDDIGLVNATYSSGRSGNTPNIVHFQTNEYLWKGGHCQRPGATYRVKVRGVMSDDRKTQWHAGNRFTVGESGCSAPSLDGAVGACTATCGSWGRKAASPDCGGASSGVVCCVPNAVYGHHDSYFPQSKFEFTTPRGSQASLYATDKLEIEWRYERGIPNKFDLFLIGRGANRRTTVLARDVSLRAGSHLVSSFQADDRLVAGRHELVASFVDGSRTLNFTTSLNLLSTPCATRPHEQYTLIGTCQTAGSCSLSRDDAGCEGLGAGVTCCYDRHRDSSFGFKDDSDALPDAALVNTASIALLGVCVTFASWF